VAALESTLAFPRPGRIKLIGAVEALSTAPGEWLVIAPSEKSDQLAKLRRHAAMAEIATADASDRVVVLELDVTVNSLARVTSLAVAALQPGRVSRVRVADIAIIVACGPGTRLRILVDRTHAPHLRAWLDRAV
jgi:heterotetrameric sarcosine oxidase gamma subunit